MKILNESFFPCNDDNKTKLKKKIIREGPIQVFGKEHGPVKVMGLHSYINKKLLSNKGQTMRTK